jgi:Protein of unknown function (DUF1329)
MDSVRRLVLCATIILWVTASTAFGAADAQDTIPVGTKITMQNWQKYKAFMPDGMAVLFEGKYFWKMPADVEMDVGPPNPTPLPTGYQQTTEKYGGQTQVVVLPNGHYGIKNYGGGMPFPNPQEPYKGWKILADDWFGPIPRLSAATRETGLGTGCGQDRLGNWSCNKVSFVYRKLAYITDPPGHPPTESLAAGAWYTEWLMQETPEQAKYTADLTIFWQDLERWEDNYVFVPALRRSYRISTTARCAPVFGGDFTHDDARAGFNGRISIFQAKFLRDQKMLALTDLTTADGNYPGNYDLPLGWAKPSWGAWSLRDMYVIDVRRIPQEAPGYCYGKRIMYVDKYFLHELWTDIYDANMELWKVLSVQGAPKMVNGVPSSIIATLNVSMWDLQNDHETLFFTAEGPGRDIVIDEAVPREYDDIPRYSTPGGLMQIMR